MFSHFDRGGNPISEDEWMGLSSDPTYVRVGRTEIVSDGPPRSSVDISTVWTGLNTELPQCRPLIFETLVRQDGQIETTQCYSDRDAAVEGHNDLVGQWISRLPGARIRELDGPPTPEC